MEQENREIEEITIKDIARMCGVGVSTVSRAINNHPDINPETSCQGLFIKKISNSIICCTMLVVYVIWLYN